MSPNSFDLYVIIAGLILAALQLIVLVAVEIFKTWRSQKLQKEFSHDYHPR